VGQAQTAIGLVAGKGALGQIELPNSLVRRVSHVVPECCADFMGTVNHVLDLELDSRACTRLRGQPRDNRAVGQGRANGLLVESLGAIQRE
jgi:hypothetical protein